MMLHWAMHSLHKEASSLLCEAVQDSVCNRHILHILHNINILHIIHICFIIQLELTTETKSTTGGWKITGQTMGGSNLWYHALRQEMILHGNAGEMGTYAVLSVLPDKIACFLYEYHDSSYTSLDLPVIPLDRSNVSVHSILRPDQVKYVIYVSYAKYG